MLEAYSVVYKLYSADRPVSEVLGTELIDESARAVGLANDAFAVILAYRATHFVVVHCRAVLALSPQLRDVRRVLDLEDAC